MHRKWILSALIAALALTACGQKGPLRVPEPPKSASLGTSAHPLMGGVR